MADSNCLVSIVLPVYNGFPYLSKAVESIVGQTEKRWKLIVVNDGSTDESKDYLDSIKDPRVVVIHQENQGLSPALNRGLAECDTPLIGRMDGDDISYSTRLEKQVSYLQQNPDVGLLGTQIQRVGSVRSDSGSDLPVTHQAIWDALMAGQHAICHPTIVCRREVFDLVGGYKEGLGEEWDMFLRIGEQWQLANLPECLFGYRYHSTSINGSRMGELRRRIRFQCECARRRNNGESPILYEDYVKSENEGSILRRTCRGIEDFSRASYHAAVADILGKHRLRGYARLGFAAFSAPQLTWARIHRRLRRSSNTAGSEN